jgi:hypothetical protein
MNPQPPTQKEKALCLDSTTLFAYQSGLTITGQASRLGQLRPRDEN